MSMANVILRFISRKLEAIIDHYNRYVLLISGTNNTKTEFCIIVICQIVVVFITIGFHNENTIEWVTILIYCVKMSCLK